MCCMAAEKDQNFTRFYEKIVLTMLSEAIGSMGRIRNG